MKVTEAKTSGRQFQPLSSTTWAKLPEETPGHRVSKYTASMPAASSQGSREFTTCPGRVGSFSVVISPPKLKSCWHTRRHEGLSRPGLYKPRGVDFNRKCPKPSTAHLTLFRRRVILRTTARGNRRTKNAGSWLRKPVM